MLKKIKTVTLEELKVKYTDEDGDWDCDIRDIIPQKEVYGFGKLYWDNTAQQIYSTGVPLFDNEEVMERFNDYVPYVVGKEGLLKAIEIYHKNIVNYYNGLLVDDNEDEVFRPQTSAEKIQKHIKDKIFIWSNPFNYRIDLDEEKTYQICDFMEYEHMIFQLVHLLKVIDWETQTLLFYGW